MSGGKALLFAQAIEPAGYKPWTFIGVVYVPLLLSLVSLALLGEVDVEILF